MTTHKFLSFHDRVLTAKVLQVLSILASVVRWAQSLPSSTFLYVHKIFHGNGIKTIMNLSGLTLKITLSINAIIHNVQITKK
jgi:hypothetical protein